MKKILVLGLILVPVFLLGFTFTGAPRSPDAQSQAVYADVLCGNGSEADDYDFNYPLEQYHWTVDGKAYLSDSTIDELDQIFDKLNEESVVQTMILFKPAAEVGNRVNCAVHFLRYMQLGLPSGERKDNGYVFLIVVEEDEIDVHYGVGLGLPALTAHNLTEINRLAEDTYTETGDMDKAILTMAYSFANYAREQYPALTSAASNPVQEGYSGNAVDATSAETIQLPALADLSITSLACLCCVSIIILVVFLMIVRSLFRGGSRRGGGGWGGFRPSGGGGFSGWSRPSGGGFRPSLPTRGGSGSGRSHRGN
jgi:hypothetical protein